MSLRTAHCVVLRPPFLIRQVQYVQIFLLKPASFWLLFAGFAAPTRLPLLFSQTSRSVLAALSSSPPLLLSHTLWHIWLESILSLLRFLSGYSVSWVTHLTLEMTRPMSWSGGMHCSIHPLSHVVSLLTLVSTLRLCRTRGMLSYRNSLTHRFTEYLLWNLCFLVTLVVSFLVFAATLQWT